MKDCEGKNFHFALSRLFREAVALEKVDDAELTPEEPYKSKYAARKIYEGILDRVTEAEDASKAGSKAASNAEVALETEEASEAKTAPAAEVASKAEAASKAEVASEAEPASRAEALSSTRTDGDQSCLLACRLTTLLHLGINAYETEEVADGERRLRECLALVESRRLQPNFVSLYIHVSNHTGIVWNLRKDHEKSLEFFKRAERAYLDYTAATAGDGGCDWTTPDGLARCFRVDEGRSESGSSDGSSPTVDDDRRGDIDKMRREFESLHTHTLYFLAQGYERLGEKERSAACCHETLWRQLKRENADLDVCDWSRNAAILSQYYVGTGEMKTARHCLAAAAVMFGGQEFKAEVEEKEEERDKTGAEMKRCWSAFALSLLRYSREAEARAEGGDRDPDVTDELLERVAANAAEDVAGGSPLSFLRDGRLDAEKVADQESKVGVDLVESFDEARALFLFGTNCLEDAKTFYAKDSHCGDYVSILQSNSQFYKMLADFEPDVGRKCKMHKRRIDSLTEILMVYILPVCYSGWTGFFFTTVCK